MRRMNRVLAHIWIAALLAGCAGLPVPESAQIGSTQTAAAGGAAPQGVSPESPVAGVALAVSCRTGRGCLLLPIDPARAVPAGVAAQPTGHYSIHALSPDGRTMATVAYASTMSTTGGRLIFTDLETWQAITTTITVDDVMIPPVFSADGGRIALVAPASGYPPKDKLILIDVASGQERVSERLPIYPRRLAFAPDGKSIHVYGTVVEPEIGGVNPRAAVVTLDAGTLAVTWQQELDGVRDGQFVDDAAQEAAARAGMDPHIGMWWEPGTLFSADGSTLYIAHADADRLTTVDFVAERVAVAPVQPAQSLIERLLAWTARPAHAKVLNGTARQMALSPDGRTLYVAGVERSMTDDVYREEPLPLQIVDVETATLLGEGPPASTVRVGQDGWLYLSVWQYSSTMSDATAYTEVYDPQEGSVLARLEGWTVMPVPRIGGGEALAAQHDASGDGSILALVDPVTFAVTRLPAEVNGSRPATYGYWFTP